MFALNELGCRRGRRKDTGNFCAPRALNPFMYRFMAFIGGYWLAGRGGVLVHASRSELTGHQSAGTGEWW